MTMDKMTAELIRKVTELEQRLDDLVKPEVSMGRNYGWDGSEWRKLPLLWGYSEQYLESEINTGDGSNLTQNFSTVPAGEIWIVTAFTAYAHDGDHASRVIMFLYDGGSSYYLKFLPSLAAGTSIEAPTPIIMEEGDQLRVTWVSAANGDSFRSYAVGYKMLIAE